MSIAYLCDGCGGAIKEKPEETGNVIKRHYCKPCLPIANAFTAAEERARVAVHAEFIAQRTALIQEHGKDGFKLPDVVYAD